VKYRYDPRAVEDLEEACDYVHIVGIVHLQRGSDYWKDRLKKRP
jgi:hypothetical protein